MLTKLVFQCASDFFGSVINDNLDAKNGTVIEELLKNNYSFKRSCYYVQSVNLVEKTIPGGFEVSVIFNHDECELSFLISFAKQIIDRVDATFMRIKSCNHGVYYSCNVGIFKTSYYKFDAANIFSMFEEYFSGVVIGYNFPKSLSVGSDIKASVASPITTRNEFKEIKYSLNFNGQLTGFFKLAFSSHDYEKFNLYGCFGLKSAIWQDDPIFHTPFSKQVVSNESIINSIFISIVESFIDDWAESKSIIKIYDKTL